jgi:hypothetical protein
MPANRPKHKRELPTFPEVVSAPMLRSRLSIVGGKASKKLKKGDARAGVPLRASRVRFAHRW